MLKSKLPNVGTTIFTTMSALANQHNAINLSQGFPGFDCPDFLKQQLTHHTNAGANQYAPMTGIPELQQQIAMMVQRKYSNKITDTEITVTSGATEALFVAIQTIVHPGDEVIVFDPAYDSYEPAVDMAGGRCIHLPLTAPDYTIDWTAVTHAITPKTRAIIINSPHNPTGSVLSANDIKQLKQLVEQHGLYVISDEVYEHITFDGREHHSILADETLYQRAFVVSSFGKTFHVTGWKIGYCVAPPALTAEFRKIHQYVTFSTSTPMQKALSDMMEKYPGHIDELGRFYQQKRDVLAALLVDSPFKLLPCHGTYFQLVDYSAISSLNDVEFCRWMTETHKIAAIPLTVFYQQPPQGDAGKIIRLCFAKDESVLIEAGKKLQAIQGK